MISSWPSSLSPPCAAGAGVGAGAAPPGVTAVVPVPGPGAGLVWSESFFLQAVGASSTATIIDTTNVERFMAVLLFLQGPDRKSTRLNSSHSQISYAVFCLKKKKKKKK